MMVVIVVIILFLNLFYGLASNVYDQHVQCSAAPIILLVLFLLPPPKGFLISL